MQKTTISLTGLKPLFAFRMAFMVIFSICSAVGLSAQSQEIDSLRNLLKQKLPPVQKTESLYQLARQLQDFDPTESNRVYSEGLTLAQSRNDTLNIVKIIEGMGVNHYNLGNLDDAARAWRKILRLREFRKDSLGLGMTHSNLGMVHETRGDLDSAIIAYDLALAYYRRHGKPLHNAIVNNNLGLVYEKQGDYGRAMESFLQALAGFEQESHLSGQSSVYTNLGMVSYKQKDFNRSQAYNRKAIEIKIQLNDLNSVALAYNNIGSTHEALENLDSTLYYHEKALEIRLKLNDQLGICASYNNIGIAYAHLGKYDLARDYQQKAYTLALQTGSHSDLARASADLGGAFLKLGDFKQAEKFLTESLALSTKVDEPVNRLKVYRFLQELYKVQKDFRAFAYADLHAALEDSLRNDEHIREIARLESKYQFDKEKELLALEHERNEALLEGRLQRQRMARNASLGGLAAGLVILFILWRGYRQKQNTNHILETQKNTIQKTLEERETLLKEIHHRVKNNLQVVSSLLSLQSRTIQDPIALGAIEEGRNRVKAMALIHQNLYQEENLVGVDLPVYIEKLTDSLVGSYKVDTQRIHIQREIDPVSIDVDVLIPLGLILNELITNALKYAFINREEGEIDIEVRQKPEGLEVMVKDNGVGLPPGFNPEQSPSLGFKLIRSFVNKMKARLEILSEDGTRVHIFLPNP